MCLKGSWSDFDPQAYNLYGEDQNHETSFKGKALQAAVDSWCKIQVIPNKNRWERPSIYPESCTKYRREAPKALFLKDGILSSARRTDILDEVPYAFAGPYEENKKRDCIRNQIDLFRMQSPFSEVVMSR